MRRTTNNNPLCNCPHSTHSLHHRQQMCNIASHLKYLQRTHSLTLLKSGIIYFNCHQVRDSPTQSDHFCHQQEEQKEWMVSIRASSILWCCYYLFAICGFSVPIPRPGFISVQDINDVRSFVSPLHYPPRTGGRESVGTVGWSILWSLGRGVIVVTLN